MSFKLLILANLVLSHPTSTHASEERTGFHGFWHPGGVQAGSPFPSKAWLAESLPRAGFAPTCAGSGCAVGALARGVPRMAGDTQTVPSALRLVCPSWGLF